METKEKYDTLNTLKNLFPQDELYNNIFDKIIKAEKDYDIVVENERKKDKSENIILMNKIKSILTLMLSFSILSSLLAISFLEFSQRSPLWEILPYINIGTSILLVIVVVINERMKDTQYANYNRLRFCRYELKKDIDTYELVYINRKLKEKYEIINTMETDQYTTVKLVQYYDISKDDSIEQYTYDFIIFYSNYLFKIELIKDYVCDRRCNI